MELNRRKFLTGLGACAGGGVVGTLLSPLPWKVMDDVAIWTQNWPWTPVPQDGPYTYVSSVCALCPAGCGITVRKVQNRAVKIEGLKDHPINNGRLCPLGFSGLQYLYGPARVKSPLKRMGKRGDGIWQPISWDAAISEVAQKLSALRAKDKPHAVAWIAGEKNGTIAGLIARFLKAYGSPNLLQEASAQDALNQAVFLTQGRQGTVWWDIENADFILSFGAGLADGWGTPSSMNGFLGNASGNKTLIQIEPRLSDTAAKASRWIPINPGTESALALGIAHIIVRELLYNIDFVNAHAFGFDDVIDKRGHVTQGFMSVVLKQYPPGKVSEITGVPVDTIFEIARGFAGADKPVAIYGRGRGMTAGSMDEALAGVYLNALVANIDQPGGVYVVGQPDYIKLPEPVLDQAAEKGNTQPRMDGAGSDRFPNARHLLYRMPGVINSANGENPVEALLVSGANPLYTMPDTKAAKKSFDRIPFIVSFSPFMDETAAYSDLFLPDHTYLESYRDVVSLQNAAGAVISLAKPVVRPLYNTRHLGDVVIQLAKSIGGSVKNAFAWETYNAMLKEVLSDNWKELTTQGFVRVAHQNLKPGAHAFSTPSKKFEFQLKGAIQTDSSPAAPVTAGVEGDPRQFPLALIFYDSIRIAGNHMANPPFMTKTIDDTVLKKTYSFIEINPATARQLRLADGDTVKLTTPKGEADVKVHFYDGVMPGVIALPRGLGHLAYTEEWGLSGRGINVNSLMGPVEDPASGFDMAWGIRAKLTKV
jgi:menaquinone reductase, molybdopterin-binding-like subunit